MKKLFIIILLCLFSVGSVYSQGLKVGEINSEELMLSYPAFKRIEDQLARELQNWQVERAKWEEGMELMQNDIIEREKKLQSGATTFSENRKAELQIQIDSLRMNFQLQWNQQLLADQEKQQTLTNRRDELLGEVLQEIHAAIKEIGEEMDYDLIVDSAGTVIYAKDPIDITDILLRHLQER